MLKAWLPSVSADAQDSRGRLMFAIQKEFHFCYGHRVWSQKLDGRFTERGAVETKCRHLHGHQAAVSVSLDAHELDNQMVTDFKHLGWLKDFFEDYVDHKFILDISDPLASKILGVQLEAITGLVGPIFRGEGFRFEPILVETNVAAWQLAPSQTDEYLRGFLLVNFCPTSERLAEWVWNIVSTKMDALNVTPGQVIWSETPKSSAVYMPEQYVFDPAS